MSKERDFVVPNRAIEEGAAPGPSDEGEQTEPVFELPPQVARDLGITAGDVSVASALLAPQEAIPSVTYEQTDRDRELRRAGRNFSFTDGETTSLFDALSQESQGRILKLRGKLIKKYADRGLSERSIGLLAINLLDNGLQGSGTMMFPGSSREYHYQVMWMGHLGTPLDDQPDGQQQPESTTTHIKYRGAKLPVVDLTKTKAFDWLRLTQVMGGAWFEWADALPRIGEDQWAPAVKLDGWVL